MTRRYLPFTTGAYTTAAGLTAMSKALSDYDQRVFQIDENYDAYYENKISCRQEDIHKYYLEHQLSERTIRHVNRYIVDQLVREYPEQFTYDAANQSLSNTKTAQSIKWNDDGVLTAEGMWVSLFDALCSQVQEDVAIFQLDAGGAHDFLTAIHLCSPNHWSPAEKIGKRFDRIHEPVPHMEKVLTHYLKLLTSIIQSKGPYTRFAWGIATDGRLNHHPVAPSGVDPELWQGRKSDYSNQKFYVRTERQNLIGFPEVNAFMFTIRTYFYDVETLTAQEKKLLASALDTMSPQTLAYKGLTNNLDGIKARLR